MSVAPSKPDLKSFFTLHISYSFLHFNEILTRAEMSSLLLLDESIWRLLEPQIKIILKILKMFMEIKHTFCVEIYVTSSTVETSLTRESCS